MKPRLAAAAAATVLLLAGCDADAGGAGAGPGTAPTSAAPSGSATDAAGESPTATESTPEVAPATGPVIRVRGLRARVPKGWRTTIPLAIGQHAFPPTVLGTSIAADLFPNGDLFTVDELGDQQLNRFGRRGRRLDDLVIDGQQVYHLVGTAEPGVPAERFGTIVDDQRVSLEFRFANGEKPAERDEIIQSVLATVEYGG